MPETPDLVSRVKALRQDLLQDLDSLMTLHPFWREFAPLLEAVEVEKLVITLILQLVVVIAIFNVLAFVTFIGQQKAGDIFLFQALGASKKNVTRGWLILLGAIWLVSCLLASGFAAAFEWAMLHMDFLELPGKIYSLGRIQVVLSPTSYAVTFFLAFLWLMGLSWPELRRLQRKSLLSRLRLEFS